MKGKTKIFNSAPLPFQGQKRAFVSLFRTALKEVGEKREIKVIVDLFGGSGLLAHHAKRIFPEAKVIYNDFDNYCHRLRNVDRTNQLINDFRAISDGFPYKAKLPPEEARRILRRVEKEEKTGFVDYITISTSLLFSRKYVTSYEELKASTMYNSVIKSGYQFDPAEYLNGLQIVRQDYFELFNEYKDTPDVLFLVDPPYLTTDTETYNSNLYWKLKDYLNVLRVLKNTNYFFFTSDKSSLLEICKWFEQNCNMANPFAGSIVHSRKNMPTGFSSYTDMMIYKFNT